LKSKALFYNAEPPVSFSPSVPSEHIKVLQGFNECCRRNYRFSRSIYSREIRKKTAV